MTRTTDGGPSRRDIATFSVSRALTIWGTRIAPALMAPLGILLTIPLLVAAVGLAIWWQGHVAVIESVDAIATRQFDDRAEQAAQHTRALLDQAEPLTDNMVAYVRRVGLDPPLEDFALTFRDQLRACPGVAYISFGTREGHYFGVYLDEHGRYVTTRRRYGGPQRTHRRDFVIGDDCSLTLVDDDPTHGFDPRARPWWQAAVANGRRTWSQPYVWFDIGVVGITCSEPIFDDAGDVIAVTTVDFHLNGLSEFVETLQTAEGGRTVIFTESQDVIAFPGARQEFGQGEARGKKLRVEDIEEPVARALFDALLPVTDEPVRHIAFESGGEPYLAVMRHIEIGDDGRWFVVTFGPTAALTAPAAAHRRNALIVSAVALVIAILVAAFFARFIVRTHLRVVRAEDRARAADEQLQRLGSYQLTRKLDEGGMGEVWIASHAMLARPAAIKLIRPKYLAQKSHAEQSAAVERFRREARTIAGMRSRHTIGIYDFGVADDGALFYVMELLDGIDLRTLVREYGPVPVRRAVGILIQAAASLREAHERGVVHRDVKPANIFLCREADELDVVKVLDFGVARQIGGDDLEKTMGDGLWGTPAYMSPEQVSTRKDLDGRTDVYSLGCVAYWLLAGRSVFVRKGTLAMLEAQLSEEPQPLDSVAPNPIPPALESVVMRCLAKKREDRPADMAALVMELEAILARLRDDGWNVETSRAWWRAVPSIFDTLESDPTDVVRLSPKRSGTSRDAAVNAVNARS